MEIIIDVIGEILLDVLADGFFFVGNVFFDRRKRSRRKSKVIRIFSMLISALLFFGLFIGIILLANSDGKSAFGWISLSLSIVYLVCGITVKVISYFGK